MSCLKDAYSSTIVFEGDSIQAGTTVGASDVHTFKMRRNLLRSWNLANYAVGGSTTTSMSSRSAPAVAVASASSIKALIIWVGTNDLNFTTDTAAAIMARITTYVNAMRSAGFNRVVAMTVFPVDVGAASLVGAPGTATHETRRQQLNTLLRQQLGGLFDKIADIGVHPVLGNIANTTNPAWYSDGVHITAAGYDLVVDFLTPILASL